MKKVVAKKTKVNKKNVVKKPVKKSTKKIVKQTTAKKATKKVVKKTNKKPVAKTKKPVKSTKVKAKVAPKKTTAKTKAKPKVKTAAKTKTTVKAKTVVKPKAPKKLAKSVKPETVSKAKATKKVVPVIKKAPVIKLKKGAGPVNVKPYQVKKNEEYMSEEQRNHFRSVLLKWKEQLMAEVDRTMHHMQDEVSNYPDPVDRASQEEEFSLELRARDRERKLLRKINDALNRINDNDYGYCDDCGAEIGISRLEVRPTATQCIECKTVAEIREKQIGDGNIFD